MDDDALGLKLINRLQHDNNNGVCVLLERWLPFQKNISDDLMEKLLIRVFHCVWHADEVFYPYNLINNLSSILPRFRNSSLSLRYFSSFLLTMRRKWPDIDALRLGDFHLLIRRFLYYSFLFLRIHSWDLDLTSRLISLLEDTCFLVEQGNINKSSFGVSYHIASVFLKELKPFLPLPPEVIEIVFKPFISVMGSLPDKVLLGKIKRNMFDVLLKKGNKLLEVKKLGDDNHEVLGTIALTIGFSSKFFELASSDECCQGNMNRNRKVLFVLAEQFLKLEKDLESSGIQVSIPRELKPLMMMKEKEKEKGKKKKKKMKMKRKFSCRLLIKKMKKNDVSENVAAEGGLDNDAVEDVAAEVGLDNDAVEDVASSCELPKTKTKVKKCGTKHNWLYPFQDVITLRKLPINRIIGGRFYYGNCQV